MMFVYYSIGLIVVLCAEVGPPRIRDRLILFAVLAGLTWIFGRATEAIGIGPTPLWLGILFAFVVLLAGARTWFLYQDRNQ